MNGQKLNIIITWLFLVCLISTIYQVYVCTYKNLMFFRTEIKSYLWEVVYFNSIVAGIVSFNLFAYYLKRPNLYRWGKYGFGLFVIGCCLIICFFIPDFIESIRTGKTSHQSDFIVFFMESSALLSLAFPGFFITSNLYKEYKKETEKIKMEKVVINLLPMNNGKIIQTQKSFNNCKQNDFDFRKLTFFFNIFICTILILSNVWAALQLFNIFEPIMLICFTVTFALSFSIPAFIFTKKWILHVPVIIGYSIWELRDLFILGVCVMEIFHNHKDPESLSELMHAFIPIMIDMIIGIFGLILTIHSCKEAKKHVEKVADAILLPFNTVAEDSKSTTTWLSEAAED